MRDHKQQHAGCGLGLASALFLISHGRHGEAEAVGGVLRRLRCQGCRARPSFVAIDNGLGGWRSSIVKLESPGAYD